MKKIILIFSILFNCGFLFSQNLLHHVEPISWWVNMKSSKFQILIHGDQLKELDINIPDSKIELLKVHYLENENYVALDVEVIERGEAFSFDIYFSKNDQLIEKYNYQMGLKSERNMENESFSSKDVIYLITPDRFSNGDKNNDIIKSLKEQKMNRQDPSARHGGDIQGIINHLDYIAEMGFTAIWSTPLLENNMKELSYHGYAITDLYKIDPRMGSNDLYKELALKAKAKGIKLIKDVVLNHIGSNHWWMNDLPSENWINNTANYVNTSHTREALHDPYSVEKDVVGFTDGWFVKQMPDLNQRNPFLATYIIQNSLWWIEYAQLSGFRVDTYSYSDRDFLNSWNKAIDNEYPGFNIVGEEWTTDKSIIGLWQKPNLIQKEAVSIIQKHPSFIPSLMDFPLNEALVEALQPKDQKWDHKLSILYRNMAQDYLYPKAGNMVVFLDNHDMSRAYYQLKHDFSYWKMAQAFLMINRGIPQVYYGTEVLLSDSVKPGDHGVLREDFPGGWDSDVKNAFLGKMSVLQNDAQVFLKQLLNWRKNCTAIHNGELKHFAPTYENEVYTVVRYDENSLVLLVLNNEEDNIEIIPNNYINEIDFKKTATKAKVIMTNNFIDLNTKVSINPKNFLLLEIEL
jgi:glycosidase